VLDHLGIDRADLYGYNMGASIALEIAVRRPERVRRLIRVSVSFRKDGLHPGLLAGLGRLSPEHRGVPARDQAVAVRIAHDSRASMSATSRMRNPFTGWRAAIAGDDVRIATNTD